MKTIFSLYFFFVISTATMKDSKVILTEIDSQRTGRIFLNAIQVGLATGSPVHEIQSYINNIRFMIEQEQKDADLFIQNTEASCNRLLHDFATNLAYHQQQFKAHSKIVYQIRNMSMYLGDKNKQQKNTLKVIFVNIYNKYFLIELSIISLVQNISIDCQEVHIFFHNF
ncbi:unnamed protein product [Paramecium sonneborni]|uniref:Uncharacterized protein n=1 Tax=Paramecium sonneborni TaxID=65129 RepID=A0A8S1P5Q3_9CILI|nr:unnamed protein product [Paramecium sonneborni]